MKNSKKYEKSKNMGQGGEAGETPATLAAPTENPTMATLALSFYYWAHSIL